MATPQEKAQSVAWFFKQNRMSRLNETAKLSMEEIHHRPFFHSCMARQEIYGDRRVVLDKEMRGRPKTSEENINRVSQAFTCSPTESIHTAARQLQLPCSTVRLRSSQELTVVRLQNAIVKGLEPNDKPKRREFAEEMLELIDLRYSDRCKKSITVLMSFVQRMVSI